MTINKTTETAVISETGNYDKLVGIAHGLKCKVIGGNSKCSVVTGKRYTGAISLQPGYSCYLLTLVKIN